MSKKTSLTKTNSNAPNNVDKQMAENLAQDMSDLMQDFDTVSRINSMVAGLKCSYPGLTGDCMAAIMDQIQKSIRQKVATASTLSSLSSLSSSSLSSSSSTS